jgi:hypothetical protein
VNPGLQTLDGIETLAHAQGLRMCNNGDPIALRSIDGARAALVGDLGSVSIHMAPQLDSILALDEVTHIDSLTLEGQLGVVDLQGMGALIVVETSLVLSGNPQLTSLAGLESLAHVGSIAITDNPTLPQAEAEAFVATLEVDGGTQVCGNLGGDPCP